METTGNFSSVTHANLRYKWANLSLAAAQKVINNTIACRQSYFQGAPRIVQEQNALDVNRGLGVAFIQSQNYDSQNDFNKDIFGIQSTNNNNHNDVNRGNNSSQLGYQAEQNRTNQQRLSGVGSALGNLFSFA